MKRDVEDMSASATMPQRDKTRTNDSAACSQY